MGLKVAVCINFVIIVYTPAFTTASRVRIRKFSCLNNESAVSIVLLIYHLDTEKYIILIMYDTEKYIILIMYVRRLINENI